MPSRREFLAGLIGASAVRECPKALYLSFYGVGDGRLRTAALRVLETTELNAVVIDVKGDRGMVSYPSDVALARQCGAQALIPAPNLAGLIRHLHERGFYTIARQVVFKDDRLGTHAREWAVKRLDGSLYVDREGLAWCDPMCEGVQKYNIDVAEEAAWLGFDEVQFDYVRFPDSEGLVFRKPNTMVNRVDTIVGFLHEARRRLQPLHVALAADVFGYVLWNTNDTGIGQQLEQMLPAVDYLCPMLYPSSFQHGIPGISNPVSEPHGIVLRSLRNAEQRAKVEARRFRPWLQAFDDYAFDRRAFGRAAIRSQVDAAEKCGADGWMLWNPRNVYRAEDLGAKWAATPK